MKKDAVTGATGAQGGALVRAITRDADSQKARKLAQAGAEIVEADLDWLNKDANNIPGEAKI